MKLKEKNFVPLLKLKDNKLFSNSEIVPDSVNFESKKVIFEEDNENTSSLFDKKRHVSGKS